VAGVYDRRSDSEILEMSSVTNHELAKPGSILSGPTDTREFPDWFR